MNIAHVRSFGRLHGKVWLKIMYLTAANGEYRAKIAFAGA